MKPQKMKKYTILLLSAGIIAGFSSCENASQDFPDYEGGTTVYFAKQTPVRCIVLGEDPVHPQANVLDQQHQMMIYATMGGAYNASKFNVDVAVDPTLTDRLTFDDGTPVTPMPESYYTLSNKLTEVSPSTEGFLVGTRVQLTDAFFADPKALTTHYVIPLVITGATGVDHILRGTVASEGATPDRTNAPEWSVQPKDYVLYAVRYINPYDAQWARHGVDRVTAGGVTTTEVRHQIYVERDPRIALKSASLNECHWDYEHGADRAVLSLKFADDGTVTVSSATEGVTATGSGKWVKDGEKKTFNNEDHDAIYLDYTVNFPGSSVATTDTLTLVNRDVKSETFSFTYNM